MAALLLLAAMAIASGRLIATEWTDHLAVIQLIAILAVAAGLALGRSIFSARVAAVFAVCYGLFAVVRQLSLLLKLGPAVLWQERLLALGSRLLAAWGQLLRREEVTDPLLFLFFMAVLFWGLGVHAGYSLTRHTNPWRAILPTGLALLIIQLTDPYVASRGRYLPFYLFVSLLLIARVTYLRYRIRWEEENTHVPSYIASDLTYPILVSAALIVILAWSVPALLRTVPGARETWLKATRSLREWIEERGEEAFAALRRSATSVGISDRYGQELALGLGAPLGDAVVMTVQPPYHLVGVQYYWRARVYDHYANGQWSTVAFSVTQSVPASVSALNIPELSLREGNVFTFTAVIPFITLHAPPQPAWVSRQALVDMASNPDGTWDVAALRADPPVYAGESYQARSALSNELTILQLRAAGTDYPDWVKARYLQLPPEITPRTRELARIIAGDLDNPYDIAQAVTAYLRMNIAYTETVPPPPPNREPLDWFLFELQEGFCNYYASAEVVLLRSLGIPARLAVGYAGGEKDRTSGLYLVRHRDAHAWPEVYFPGLGWVEFEPTASQPPIYRPSGTTGPDVRFGVPGPSGYEEYLEMLEARLDRLRMEEEASALPTAVQPQRSGLYLALFILLGVGGGYLLVVAWRRQRLRRNLPPVPLLLETGLRKLGIQPPAPLQRWATYATASPLERAYWELNQALRRLGASPAPSDTPAERAATLIRLLPTAAQAVHILITEYQTATYGPGPGDAEQATQAGRAIRRLSWQSYLQGQLREKSDDLLRPLRLLARRFA
ncbi:MAG: DUF3488 and transglutaminase-like domain-containing protein [Anaerolineae bacterium]|nr:DUF3488 and transglutaminase-like domain-containing protein [Anaerolineae bacterium]